ncbi:MAG: acyl-CoA/acyl-ACP dehydrogenase [Hyphomicrobiales bacterium]|nr:acyl-CoA/acyl-ACP dehydrogenase [Hyphomicrobiales bacterium]
MDFTLTEEQIAFREVAREFAEKEIRAPAIALDKQVASRDCFPWDIVRKGSQLGLRTLALSERFGGVAASVLDQSIVIRELSRGDPGAAAVFAQCWKISRMIEVAGTDDQRERYLTPFADDHECVLSMLTTEPGAGSDNHLPFDAPGSGLSLSAVREGDHYVLNGMKHFCSLVSFSKIMLVFGRTDKSVGVSQGTTCFIVRKDTPGITFGQVHDKMGWRLFPNGETYFDNVRVPVEDRLGDEGKAYPQVRWYFGKTVETPSFALGVAQAAYERALRYTQERIQGGGPLIRQPAVSIALGEMKMLLQAAESFVWRTAWCIDNDPGYTPALGMHCRVFVLDACVKIVQKAMMLMGGSGVMRDEVMEKHCRDILCMGHTDGGRDVSLLKAIKYV